MKTINHSRGFALIPIILIGVFLVGAGAIIIPNLINPKTPQTVQQVETLPEGWEQFASDKFGYSLKHPKGWTVDDSDFPSKQEIRVISPAKDASLRINAFIDTSMKSPEAVQSAMDAFETKMRTESDMTVRQFASKVEDNTGGFIGVGEQTIDGELYMFESRGLLGTSGKILIFHGVVKKSVAGQYEGVMPKLIDGFQLEK